MTTQITPVNGRLCVRCGSLAANSHLSLQPNPHDPSLRHWSVDLCVGCINHIILAYHELPASDPTGWNEILTLTEDQIVEADHQVRCVPFATEEQRCFHKHIEYANELWHVLQGLRTHPDGRNLVVFTTLPDSEED